jgi:hypothetical protein
MIAMGRIFEPVRRWLLAAVIAAAACAPLPASGSYILNELTGFGAAGEDEHFESVVLLAHMDGADASTTFTDSSLKRHALTANGNAQIDTSQSKFGGASYQNGAGSAGDYISIPDSDDWTFGSQNFTIEFFVRHTSGAVQHMLAQDVDTDNRWRLYNDGTAGYIFQSRSGGSTQVECTEPSVGFSNNVWYHVAFVRNGGTFTIYRDGVSVASTSASVTLPNLSAPLRIGSNDTGTEFVLLGWMDELRITKGVARYTGNFTAPTKAFPDE